MRGTSLEMPEVRPHGNPEAQANLPEMRVEAPCPEETGASTDPRNAV